MNRFIKIDREDFQTELFDNPIYWKIWTWCVSQASWEKKDIMVGNQKISLDIGQFVAGKQKQIDELKVTEKQYRRAIGALKRANKIAIKGTNKFSVITVINSMDCDVSVIPEGRTKGRTKGRTNKEVKDGNDLLFLVENGSSFSGNMKIALLDFITMRKEIKKPLSPKGYELLINKLNKLSPDECGRIEILENSIMNGWQGIFPLDKNKKDTERDDLMDTLQRLRDAKEPEGSFF